MRSTLCTYSIFARLPFAAIRSATSILDPDAFDAALLPSSPSRERLLSFPFDLHISVTVPHLPTFLALVGAYCLLFPPLRDELLDRS